MNYKKIGMYIQNKRRENGFAHSILADKLVVDKVIVSKWEKGILIPDK